MSPTAPPTFPFDPVPHARNRWHTVRGTRVIGRWRHDEGKKVIHATLIRIVDQLTPVAGFCVWTHAHCRRSRLRIRRHARHACCYRHCCRCLIHDIHFHLTAFTSVSAVAVSAPNECSTCVRFATQINLLSVCLCLLIC